MSVTWTIEPQGPAGGGGTLVRFVMHDMSGRRVRGARPTVECHMAHPGMEPVLAPAAEIADGTYEARPTFGMAGEWSLTVSGTLADGSRIVDGGPFVRHTVR